jgi:hypothetical protein
MTSRERATLALCNTTLGNQRERILSRVAAAIAEAVAEVQGCNCDLEAAEQRGVERVLAELRSEIEITGTVTAKKALSRVIKRLQS